MNPNRKLHIDKARELHALLVSALEKNEELAEFERTTSNLDLKFAFGPLNREQVERWQKHIEAVAAGKSLTTSW